MNPLASETMQESSDKPSNGIKRLVTMSAAFASGVAAIVAVTAALLAASANASADRAALAAGVATNRVAIADQELRLRVLEKQSSEIAADARWIRAELEKRQKNQ